MLDGYKTYILAGVYALVSFAKYMGWITPGIAEAVEGLLLGGGIAALRQGVGKAESVAAKTDAVKQVDAMVTK